MSGGGKNAYIKARDERDRKFFEAGMQMGCQMVHDFVQIALRDSETMGKDTFGVNRLKKVFMKCSDLDDYYHLAFTGHKEADKRQEELDAMLREIWGEDTVPFAERYPFVKKYGYMKQQKGWVD